MKNPLTIWKERKQIERNQEMKARVIKNREAVLDVMAGSIKGSKGCPDMMMQKCPGPFCEKFMEFKAVSREGKETVFSRCADVETPLLIIELAQEIRKLNSLLEQLLKK